MDPDARAPVADGRSRTRGRMAFGADVAWGLGGSAIFALSQWLLIVAMARWGSARLVGDWTLAFAITAPVFIFGQFKLRYVLAADAAREYTWDQYSTLRLRTMGVATLALWIVALVVAPNATGLLIALVALGKGIEGLCDLRYGHRQRERDMRGVAVALGRRAAVVLVLGATALALTRSAVWIALAVAVGHGIGLWLDEVPAARPADGPIAARAVGPLLRRTLPLGLATAIGSLQAGIPRFVLDLQVSREAVGTFSLLAYPFLVGALLVGAIANAALPALAQRVADGEWRRFRRDIIALCGIGCALFALAVLTSLAAGGPLLRLVYGPEYSAYANELVWIAIGSCISWCYVFLGTGLDALRTYALQPWIYAASTAVVAASALHLTAAHGIVGVAWAMIAGAGVEVTLLLIVLVRGARRLRTVALTRCRA